MNIKRRNFLVFLGESAGAIRLDFVPRQKKVLMPFTNPAVQASVPFGRSSFQPVKGPMPLKTSGIKLAHQVEQYRTYEVVDDLVLPASFIYEVIAAWGVMVGDSRFGYNKDYCTGNCAGGTTPWGTVLSAEENFQVQLPEAVYADGTAFDPSKQAFALDDGEYAQGNVFGFVGNKYGWIGEVDPDNSQDYGTKHTWLGRYRHEAVGVRVESGKQLAFYWGCNHRGGHIYRFVSRNQIRNPRDKTNSQLLKQGMLYAAKFNSDGTRRWISLKADASVNPDSPNNIEGNLVKLPLGHSNREEEGYFEAKSDQQISQFKQFKILGNFYTGNAEAKQGAILSDALTGERKSSNAPPKPVVAIRNQKPL